MKSGAEICIIGCGGLGMILGAELKRRGLQCIVLGGATQVLFGIKGRRWATHDVISKFWTDAWVWPSLEETPGGAATIEGGCYWEGAKN
jgi:2-polyprenyl-6-methoxyphenol hydroxylase-like FAD-dependent oxidoreductase